MISFQLREEPSCRTKNPRTEEKWSRTYGCIAGTSFCLSVYENILVSVVMDEIDWTKYSWLCCDPGIYKGKLMKEKQLTRPMTEHDQWNVWMRTNLLKPISLWASTVVMLVFNGSILIIPIYMYVMRCDHEERRKSYSRHSLEWIGVKKFIYIRWEEFNGFSIDRGWHSKSDHCKTITDLHHVRHHTADSNCISLQDHRQQPILIADSRPILILQDSFCCPPAHTTHIHI